MQFMYCRIDIASPPPPSPFCNFDVRFSSPPIWVLAQNLRFSEPLVKHEQTFTELLQTSALEPTVATTIRFVNFVYPPTIFWSSTTLSWWDTFGRFLPKYVGGFHKTYRSRLYVKIRRKRNKFVVQHVCFSFPLFVALLISLFFPLAPPLSLCYLLSAVIYEPLYLQK